MASNNSMTVYTVLFTPSDEEVTERIEQLFRTTTGKKMAKRLFMQN